MTGIVRDSLELPLPGVRVAVHGTSSGYSRAVTTGRDGRFQIGFLPAGVYDLGVERIGYRPLQLLGVPVAAGEVLSLSLAITAATPPVEQVDSLRFGGSALLGASSGVYKDYGELELRRIPEERRELVELARMSSASSAELAVEGLPASLGGLLVDGVLVRPLPGTAAAAGGMTAAAFPLSAFDGVRLIAGYPDVEWAGVVGGALSALTRHGTRDFRVGAFGSWSGGDLVIPAAFDAASGSLRGLQGGAVVSGPILRDTASFVVGMELWSLDSPLLRPLAADSAGREIGSVAEESFGVALGEGGSPTVRSDVVSLFGRFDWQLGPDHSLTVGTTAALLPSASSPSGTLASVPVESVFDGQDLFSTATLLSVLGERVVQEARLSFQSSSRESAPQGGAAVPVATRFVADDLAFGFDAGRGGRVARSVAQASAAWYVDLAPHRVKVGLAGSFASHERDPLGARAGEFRFSGPAEFARGEGSFVQTVNATSTSFNLPRVGVFAQDTWTAAEGLDLTLGLRYDMESLPVDDVRPNQEWYERTGLLNADIPSRTGTLSPRFGFAWDVGARHRWLVHGGAGVYAGYADPERLEELLVDDGRIEIRRGLGELGGWPAAPDAAVAPVVGPSLTLLAAGYRAPRTTRGSLGVSRFLDSRTAIHLSAVFRRTDFLPRLTDLNLRPELAGFDAFGRPLFGSLQQQGGVLEAEPGSNRRFADFDVVSGFNIDGSSDYQAINVAVERRTSERLNLFGSYTYSRTVDDWLTRENGTGLELAPFLMAPGNGDWAEGTSDFDVPHRVAAGGELRLLATGALRLAGLYQYRSGSPFTPGFRDGVDANGDGSARNDPAFISEEVPGIEPLLQEWGCLREQVGAFAERNSCRTDGRHSLDLRLALRIARIAGSPAEIFVDGLNLVESGYSLPDRAVYLVDPAGELATAADGTVTAPLVANERFGSALSRYTAGRQLRIGLRIDY